MEFQIKINKGIKTNRLYITVALLIFIYIFEFLAAPFLIPNYIPFRINKLILIVTAVLTSVGLPVLYKREYIPETIAVAVFFFIRIYEVFNVIPRVHSPEPLMSVLIIAQLISVFILIYNSQFMTYYVQPVAVFFAAVFYQFEYFKKLHDLSLLLLILTVAVSIGTVIVSQLIKMERDRRNEVKKLYEKEVELKNRLALMRGRMLEQEKGFSMSLMTAGIAHELGNPINHLQGNIVFLEHHIDSLIRMIDVEKLTVAEEKHLSKICKDCSSIIEYSREGFRNITDVITNMKKLYGGGSRGKEKTDLKDLLSRTVQFFRTTTNMVDYLIETEYENDLYAEIAQGEYFIVFTNLLNNAAESFDRGSKIPNIIRIESSLEKGWIKIKICDNGKGIQSDNLERIFDPFFSTKNKQDNLGLGLALCREIINADGNKIKIDSSPGRGTVVTVSLKDLDK